MALATALVRSARSLIETFGNDASLYTYTTATKTSNEEGDVTVSSWGTATTIKVIDGGNQGSELVQVNQGREQIGEDEKIIRDDVSIVVNDRLTYDSINYRVISVRNERVESTTIIQIIKVSEVTGTSQW